jgi:hypothetical protein
VAISRKYIRIPWRTSFGLTEPAFDAAWGQREQALASLAAADRADDPGLALLSVDPLLDPLRADSRFQALVMKRSIS